MKKRLDIILTEGDFFPSREKARAAIMAGEVFVDGKKTDKAGAAVDESSEITITSAKQRYVSRGGLKLEKAILAFDLDFTQKILLDIGASTGGFTDCALQHGAAKVYAVDVGYGQLAWSLRQDERVVVKERLNARYLAESDVPEKVDVISIDAAFISLDKLLTPVSKLLQQDGYIVALIKPQFEAGRENVGKKGVVRDAKVHVNVINKVIMDAEKHNIFAKKLAISPIKGPEGNIEFLCLFTLHSPVEVSQELITQTVFNAHNPNT